MLDRQPRHRSATCHRRRSGVPGVAQPRRIFRLSARHRHERDTLRGHRLLVVADRRHLLQAVREVSGRDGTSINQFINTACRGKALSHAGRRLLRRTWFPGGYRCRAATPEAERRPATGFVGPVGRSLIHAGQGRLPLGSGVTAAGFADLQQAPRTRRPAAAGGQSPPGRTASRFPPNAPPSTPWTPLRVRCRPRVPPSGARDRRW